MTEQKEDVKQEEAETPSVSTEQNEQESVEETQPVEEDVKTQETDSEEESVEETEPAISQDAIEKENYKRALQKERAKRKDAQKAVEALEAEKTTTPEPQVSEPESTDDINQQWQKMQADVYLTKKMQEDPSFKDRVDLVRQEMESDLTITAEMADMRVKSNIFDEMHSEEPQEEVKKIKQIKNTATPEPTKPKLSKSPMKDLMDGKLEVKGGDSIKEAISSVQ